jgi:hypothetical protein
VASTVRLEGEEPGNSIIVVLRDVIKERVKHKWTEEDIESVRETLEGSEPVFSRALAQGGLLKHLDVYYTTNCAMNYNIASSNIPTSQVNLPDNPSNQPQNLPTLDPQIYPLLNSPPLTVTGDIRPQIQPQPVHRPADIAKQISEIAKIYTDKQKYNRSNSSFDHKHTIFIDICWRVELPEVALTRAFPTMLKGLALDQYYTNNLSGKTLKEACNSLWTFFEGPGYHYHNLDKWNITTLATITAENPEKSIYKNVQELINTLYKLQYRLTPALQSIEFLHNKIVTACQGLLACRFAVSDPPAELAALINKL